MKKPLVVILLCGVTGVLGFVLARADEPRAAPPPAQGAAQPGAVVPQDAAYTFRARDVLGMPVKDAQGQQIGAVDDLVIDGRDGQVLYAVLNYGDQNRDQLVVMPWTILQTQYGPSRDDRFITLDMEPQRIQAAPVVTRSQWPQVIYSEWPQWQPRIDKYYKVEVERKQKRRGEKIKIKEKFRDDD